MAELDSKPVLASPRASWFLNISESPKSRNVSLYWEVRKVKEVGKISLKYK